MKTILAKKAAVALSGGVDSSVAAALLKKEGYEIVGVFMQNYTDPLDPACTTPADRDSAVKAAAHLNIPLVVFDLEKQYRQKVIDYFYLEYAAGRTPNPDVMCNKEIKFGIFLNKALKELKVDYVATGHYARVVKKDGYHLFQGVDHKKDQSYFLYNLTQKELPKIIFPLGDLTKEKVRKIAQDLGLPNAQRPDSQGICFVGEVNLKNFLLKRIPVKAGKVVDLQGKVLGEHQGVAFYTIGQREGIGISGSGIPYYVVNKDVKNNLLVVASLNNDQALYRQKLIAGNLNWVGKVPKEGDKLSAKIRYRQPSQEVLVKEITQDSMVLEFSEPQRAITPGQSVVVYGGEEVLGGGVIEKGLD